MRGSDGVWRVNLTRPVSVRPCSQSTVASLTPTTSGERKEDLWSLSYSTLHCSDLRSSFYEHYIWDFGTSHCFWALKSITLHTTYIPLQPPTCYFPCALMPYMAPKTVCLCSGGLWTLVYLYYCRIRDPDWPASPSPVTFVDLTFAGS